MLVDTHTHLYLPEFENNGIDAVKRGLAENVGIMIFPNVDLTTVTPMKELHSIFPENTYMAMGLHPTEVNGGYAEAIEQIRDELHSAVESYKAVGEIGMDLYWDKSFEQQQMEVLECQMQWARSLSLPAIIHCREALPQTVEILEGYRDVPVVFHSFGGTPADVDFIRRRLNPETVMFGINGIVTFKNSGVASTLPHIGTAHLMLETDSPYLAPVPHRGKRNESAYLPLVASLCAEALQTTPEEIENSTTANAHRFFKL